MSPISVATTRSTLNDQQVEAATHFEGPALVLAGPGTGKTTTLVGRYRFLVEQGVDHASILATTFTRPAADQLRARIGRGMQERAADLMVGTFHSLCLRLLRGDLGRSLEVGPDIKIASEADRYRILREVCDRSVDVEECMDSIDRYKDRLMDPAAASRELADRVTRVTALDGAIVDAYEAYQERLSRARLHDFGDLLMVTVAGLSAKKDLRRTYSLRFRFLLVDEFQDVNPAQYELVRLLLDQHTNVWAVGDDDQAIYGWRGSDVRYILDFPREFAGTKVYRLGDNYRSVPVIVDGASGLIGHNRARFSKPLRAMAAGIGQPIIKTCACSDERREAEWIAQSIQGLAEQGVGFDDMALLVRVRYLMPTLAAALAIRGIPHFIRGGAKIWASTPSRALLGGIELWCGRTPRRWAVPAYLEREVISTVAASRRTAFHAVVQSLVGLISRRPPFSGQPEKAVEWEGTLQRVAAEAASFDDPTDFLDHAAELTAEESSDAGGGGVCISTIHQAKGLEWRAVFLAGCRVGVMPHEKADDPEEERRLAYVAMTRAKEYLAVTWAFADGASGAGPSPYIGEFTRELPPALLDACSWPPAKRARSGRAESSGSVSFAVGDRVLHATFGEGTVKATDHKSCTVFFFRDATTREMLYWALQSAT